MGNIFTVAEFSIDCEEGLCTMELAAEGTHPHILLFECHKLNFGNTPACLCYWETGGVLTLRVCCLGPFPPSFCSGVRVRGDLETRLLTIRTIGFGMRSFGTV